MLKSSVESTKTLKWEQSDFFFWMENYRNKQINNHNYVLKSLMPLVQL